MPAEKNRTKLGPPQSKLLTAVGMYANQNDLLDAQKMVRGSQRHLQMILHTRKLFGPMSEEDQIDAVKYAYGIHPRRPA